MSKEKAILNSKEQAFVGTLVKTKGFEAIDTYQDKANKLATTLNKQYQIVGLAAIMHLSTHKDLTILTNVINRMPDSLNIKAMQVWFTKYAPVDLEQSKDDEGNDVIKYVYNADKQYNFGLALENYWYKASPPPKVMPFNLDVELAKLYGKAKKRVAKPIAGDIIDTNTLAKLNALATRVA